MSVEGLEAEPVNHLLKIAKADLFRQVTFLINQMTHIEAYLQLLN